MIYKTTRFRPELQEKLLSTQKGTLTLQLMERYNDLSQLPLNAWKDVALNIPAVDKEAFLTANDYFKSMHQNIVNGKGLYIYGGAGNGKTTWSYKIARGYIEIISQTAQLNRLPVYYANVPTLMSELKLAFKDDKLQERITRNMQEADLVIFDDIGAEKSTEWSQEQLYQFINYRYSNGLAMIFTSNVSPDALEMRIADRVREATEVINFKSKSKR